MSAAPGPITPPPADVARPAPRPVAHIRLALAGGLIAGLTGDLLLRTQGLGINLALWLLVCVVALAAVQRQVLGTIPRDAGRLLVVAAIFAAWLGVRDGALLAFGNVVAAASALALAAGTAREGSAFDVARTRVRDLLGQLARALGDALVSAFPFILWTAPQAVTIPSRTRYAAVLLLRAAAVATLVSGVFALLLVNGDPVFNELAGRLPLPVADVGAVAWHLLFTALFAWPVLGVLAGGLEPAPPAAARTASWPVLSRLDVLAILGALNALFALYLAVQLRVLFGGMAYVLATTNLTLAQYARSGFFTLTVVGALALAGLVAMHASLRADSPGITPTYRRLASLTMLLVSAVMVSAVVRMALYVDQFGLTVDRLYTFGGMLWIAALFAWLRLTTIAGRPLAFVRGALRAGWAILFTVNVLNPEATVAAFNARRAAAGGTFDLAYAVTSLGADAVPAVTALLAGPDALSDDRLTPAGSQGACRHVQTLLSRWDAHNNADDSGWTVATARARAAVRAHDAALRARACAPARS